MPVLKVARLGLTLKSVDDLLDQLGTFRGRHISYGVSQGMAPSGRQHDCDLVERDANLLPTRY